MSRPSHLPPRCPHHARSSSLLALDSAFPTTQSFDEFRPIPHRPSTQSSLLERQPSWPGDWLVSPETKTKERSLRRSASDPLAIMEAASAGLWSPVSLVNDEKHVSTTTFDNLSETTEIGFEESCVYGPNSPRGRSELTNSESSIVTALLENIPANPFQCISMDSPSGFNVSELGGKRDAHLGAGCADAEKALRRRSGGQRSRVRKVQYIAELERNVIVFQDLGADLAARLSSKFLQRVALSIENEKLKRQFVLLRQEKIIKDGHYQSLKNEVERLRAIHGRHRRSRSAASCFDIGSFEGDAG